MAASIKVLLVLGCAIVALVGGYFMLVPPDPYGVSGLDLEEPVADSPPPVRIEVAQGTLPGTRKDSDRKAPDAPWQSSEDESKPPQIELHAEADLGHLDTEPEVEVTTSAAAEIQPGSVVDQHPFQFGQVRDAEPDAIARFGITPGATTPSAAPIIYPQIPGLIPQPELTAAEEGIIAVDLDTIGDVEERLASISNQVNELRETAGAAATTNDPDSDAGTPALRDVARVRETPDVAAAQPRQYTIKSGDTLAEIAQMHYGDALRWQLILDANPALDPNRMQIGQVITLPASDAVATVASRIERAAPQPVRDDASTYTVRSGDTLSSIAQRMLGSGGRWRDIFEANRSVIGETPDNLRVGMTLAIPKS